ncbi:MAG: ATP-binding cassette domain-containing protein [Anaerolineaceae bacterium]|nr:ATP-binding cassette domain-containing protein [Anaerolineaceae bacterium]
MEKINNGKPLLEICSVKKVFELPLGLIHTIMRKKPEIVTAVDHVSLEIQKGEILGVVGESGSGKTTLLRCIARIYDPESGEIFFEGKDILKLNPSELRNVRRKIQVVFQDPYSSLNPRMTVKQMLMEILSVHNIRPRSERMDHAVELLEIVGMTPDALNRLPSQFSGGQRQRIGIARSLAMEPSLLLADEPVSALDVSIQAQVINLLMNLQKMLGLTMMFVTHDLRVVQHVSHRIAVMYLGKIMENGSTHRLFEQPYHPYTQALLAAAPGLDPTIREEKPALLGEPPSPIHIPPGCVFHPRCPLAIESCRINIPELIEVEPGHFTACPVVIQLRKN